MLTRAKRPSALEPVADSADRGDVPVACNLRPDDGSARLRRWQQLADTANPHRSARWPAAQGGPGPGLVSRKSWRRWLPPRRSAADSSAGASSRMALPYGREPEAADAGSPCGAWFRVGDVELRLGSKMIPDRQQNGVPESRNPGILVTDLDTVATAKSGRTGSGSGMDTSPATDRVRPRPVRRAVGVPTAGGAVAMEHRNDRPPAGRERDGVRMSLRRAGRRS